MQVFHAALGKELAMRLELSSPAFEDAGFLPRKFAGNGDDFSPPLQWRNEPEGTKSFALMLDDPNVSEGRSHWLVYDIHGDMHSLPEHVAAQDALRDWMEDGISVKQGRNELGKVGYAGPVPTKDLPHHYTFTLYALDCYLRMPGGRTKPEVLNAMHDHILEQAQLVARYNE